MTERVVKVGIASYEQQKARLMSIARGERKPSPDEPKIWFSSIESFAQVLSTKNQLLLELIAAEKPSSVAELETLSGRKGPNLSRTLKTLARFGLVELHRQGRTLVPRTVYDRVSVELPLLATTSNGERRGVE
ncbi:HVO_A0114 family putative DNA-binding protein [Azospirillum canadense]|uniref:HVO_A0114 family putative DNA-binding protein n=1 Tax=Azospirillum canadense TaxID=403962 RepID=UPI00222796F0|nr:transcriptional regulator [Azospirillum canadense]MCW2237626.1 putative transcriptional regulator [Azospirillum canadense]